MGEVKGAASGVEGATALALAAVVGPSRWAEEAAEAAATTSHPSAPLCAGTVGSDGGVGGETASSTGGDAGGDLTRAAARHSVASGGVGDGVSFSRARGRALT